MAKLSAHGTEIARLKTESCDLSYRSDGHILKSFGSGWKLFLRFKKDVDFEAASKDHIAVRTSRPGWVEYRDLILEHTNLECRGSLHRLVVESDDRDDLHNKIHEGYSRAFPESKKERLTLDVCEELINAYVKFVEASKG